LAGARQVREAILFEAGTTRGALTGRQHASAMILGSPKDDRPFAEKLRYVFSWKDLAA
jgi:hypothetical protein